MAMISTTMSATRRTRLIVLTQRHRFLLYILGILILAPSWILCVNGLEENRVLQDDESTPPPVAVPLPLPVNEVPSSVPPLTPQPISDAPITTKAPVVSLLTTLPPAAVPIISIPITMEPVVVVETANPTAPRPTSLAPVVITPTKQPSLEDVVDIIGTPTKQPITMSPTPSPTEKPSISLNPTITSLPSQVPTSTTLPSESPTNAPTISNVPTHSPSLRPSTTPLPSFKPSQSLSPTSVTQHEELKMTLVGIGYINDVSDWEAATASFYESVYNDDTVNAINGADVEITLTNQNFNRRRRRRMQQQSSLEEDKSVEVTYTQMTSYQSRNPIVTMEEILQLPLSTEEYREEYVEKLKLLEGYDNLATVSSISIPVSDDDSAGGGDNKAVDGTNDAGGLSTGQIVAIACGSAAFVLLLVAFVFYKRMDNEEEEDGNQDDGNNSAVNSQGMGTTGSVPNSQTQKGEPLRGGPPTTTADLGDMSVASGAFPTEDGEDDAPKELLTIYAPAGKLGIVIDSPDNGAPVIHDIKETSPIAEEVQVGDRLVAVDGEDVRAMTAVKVSRLISKKGGSPRKLTLIRYVA